MYKYSHDENQPSNVFQATAQEASPGGKKAAQGVGLRQLVLSWVPWLGGAPSVGMQHPAQGVWHSKRRLELLSNVPKVWPHRSSPQGLI